MIKRQIQAGILFLAGGWIHTDGVWDIGDLLVAVALALSLFACVSGKWLPGEIAD